MTVPSSTTQIKNVGYYGLTVLEWIPLYSRFYFSGCFAQIQSWLLSISGTTATITSTGANPSLTPNYHTQGLGGTFFADTGEIYLFYQSPYNPSNLYARFRKVTLTSSTITYDSSSGTHGTMINTSFPIGSPTMWPYAIYAPDIKSAIILHSTSSNATGGSGTAVVINNTTTTNLTDENYIGISDTSKRIVIVPPDPLVTGVKVNVLPL